MEVGAIKITLKIAGMEWFENKKTSETGAK